MADTATGGPAHHQDVDWEAAARSPEFQELTQRRRSFVIPALAFVFVWYFGFIALAGYAPDFMGERLIDGFTVGYALALSQFLMTWFLGWLYLRKSDRVFDPLARRAAEKALEVSRARERSQVPHDGDGNGDRDGTAADTMRSRRFDPARSSRTSEEARH
jgi:uncharacterized membrane protein (DUF485 family)